MEWVHARDPAGRVLALPNQTPGLLARTGLTRAQVNASAWVIDRQGRRYAGAAAINRTLRELGGWRALAIPAVVPPIAWAEEAFYSWFARHRGRFARWGSTPACARPGVACEPPGSV